MSHFSVVGGGSKHHLGAKKNIYTISYGLPTEILQLPQRLVKKPLNHRTLMGVNIRVPRLMRPCPGFDFFLTIKKLSLKNCIAGNKHLAQNTPLRRLWNTQHHCGVQTQLCVLPVPQMQREAKCEAWNSHVKFKNELATSHPSLLYLCPVVLEVLTR